MKSAVMLFSACLLVKLFGSRNHSTLLMAAFLALYGIINVDEVFHEAGFYLQYPHLLGLVFPLKFLLCPLFYWYVLAMHGGQSRLSGPWLRKQLSLALCAPLIASLIAIPFYVLSAEDKLQLISGNAASSEHYQLALLGCRTGFTMFTIASVGYLVAAYRQLFFNAHKAAHGYSYAKGALLVITLGWVLACVSEFAAIKSLTSAAFYNGIQLFELAWLVLLAALSFMAEAKSTHTQVIKPQQRQSPMKKTLSDNTLLTPDQHHLIATQLKDEMLNHRAFLNPELTLASLAKLTGLREQLISDTLNSYLQQNFFEFINGYRVEYACTLLSQTDKTISTIALDAGFNSRTTFYAAFKRIHGCTPRDYRQSLKSANKICSNGAI